MEVSSLRDRRLVALFATAIIFGSGAAAAVVSLEDGAHRGGLAATEAALGALFPAPREESGAPGPPVQPPPVVAVVAEDPLAGPVFVAEPPTRAPARPSASPSPAASATTSPPSECAVVDDAPGLPGGGGPIGCEKPPRPAPPPKVELLDVGPARPGPRAGTGVEIASEPELAPGLPEPASRPGKGVEIVSEPELAPAPAVPPTPAPPPAPPQARGGPKRAHDAGVTASLAAKPGPKGKGGR